MGRSTAVEACTGQVSTVRPDRTADHWAAGPEEEEALIQAVPNTFLPTVPTTENLAKA